MKHIAKQFDLPLDDPKVAFEFQLREQWEKNRAADAHNWTDEAMAMVWYLGYSNWDLWNSLANYTRKKVMDAYRFEQEALGWNGRSFNGAALSRARKVPIHYSFWRKRAT